MRPAELLAPAGDLEKLRTALFYGADAVYLGYGKFSMRASGKPSPDSINSRTLPEAVRLCHARGARAYVTCNTLPRAEDLPELEEFLLLCRDAGADALIISDLGVMAAARRLVPELDLHISTQCGIVNCLTASELFRLGAKRVVLARELSLPEIRAVRDGSPPELELEAFVHGAMCVSFSGRCLLSDYLTGRDPNRGECAQPCRWNWKLVEEKRPNEYYPVFEDEWGTRILNAKDLCLIERLPELIDAGVTSLKIEGRTKSAYYTGVVVNAYRAALDALSQGEAVPRWAVEETRKVSCREYCEGFLDGRPDNAQYGGGYLREWEAAAVSEGMREGRLVLSQRNRIREGELLEAVAPGKPPVTVRMAGMRDADGAEISAAPHPKMRFSVAEAPDLPPGVILRRKAGNADCGNSDT